MAIKITGLFKPGGNFPLLEDIDLLGGFRVVDTIADRDAIPELNLKTGMLVKVNEDGKTYQYMGSGVWQPYDMITDVAAFETSTVPNNLVKIKLPPIVTGVDMITDLVKEAWDVEIGAGNYTLNWYFNDGAFYVGDNTTVFRINNTTKTYAAGTEFKIYTNIRNLDGFTLVNFNLIIKKTSDGSEDTVAFTMKPLFDGSDIYVGTATLSEEAYPLGLSVSRAYQYDDNYKP